MSDEEDRDESSDRRDLEKARVADTPDRDPRGTTEAEASENDTNE